MFLVDLQKKCKKRLADKPNGNYGEMEAIWHKEKLLMCGGRLHDTNSPTDYCGVYDPSSNQWDTFDTNLVRQRLTPSFLLLHQGTEQEELLITAGFRGVYENDAWVLNVDHSETLSNDNTWLMSDFTTPWKARKHCVVQVSQEKVFMVGGRFELPDTQNFTTSRNWYIYDLNAKLWQFKGTVPAAEISSRFCVRLNTGHVLFGGGESDANTNNRVMFLYDPKEDVIKTLGEFPKAECDWSSNAVIAGQKENVHFTTHNCGMKSSSWQ